MTRLVLALAVLLDAASATIWPYQTYHSSSFTPPVLNITKSGAPLADGYLIFSESNSNQLNPGAEEYSACLIMDTNGELVWNGAEEASANLAVQTYQGETVLTRWVGNVASTDGYYGHVEILDDTYTVIKSFCPDLDILTPYGVTYDCYMDVHESVITEDNTIVFTVTNVTQADLTSVGGNKSAWVYDCLVMEYDIASGEQLFRWSAIESVAVNGTYAPYPTGTQGTRTNPWPWFHINTAQPLGKGNGYLANSRFMWESYRISADGDIIWTIDGGDGHDFDLPDSPLFAWQHNARLENETESGAILRYFNNFNSLFENGTHQSTGLWLNLDYTTMEVSVLSTFSDPEEEIFSTAQGNHDILDNGNHLVETGIVPIFKEYGPDGDIRMTVQFGYPYTVAGYRGHKAAWVGRPNTTPSIVGISGTAYFSWNGATEVAYWKVYTGGVLANMKYKVTIPKSGFETHIKTNLTAGYVQVGAFDASMNFLGNSSKVVVA